MTEKHLGGIVVGLVVMILVASSLPFLSASSDWTVPVLIFLLIVIVCGLFALFAMNGLHPADRRVQRNLEQAARDLGLIYDGKNYGAMMERAAQGMGLVWAPRTDVLAREGLNQMQLFQRGESPSSHYGMRGEASGKEVLVFEYAYPAICQRPGEAAQEVTFEQTVAAFRLCGKLPAFQLEPEHVGPKSYSVFGYQGVDFARHPMFSQRFLLRGTDESAVRFLFNPSVLSFFEQIEQSRGPIIEGYGEWLIVYRDRECVLPNHLRAFFAEATAVAQAFGSGAHPE